MMLPVNILFEYNIYSFIESNDQSLHKKQIAIKITTQVIIYKILNKYERENECNKTTKKSNLKNKGILYRLTKDIFNV